MQLGFEIGSYNYTTPYGLTSLILNGPDNFDFNFHENNFSFELNNDIDSPNLKYLLMIH